MSLTFSIYQVDKYEAGTFGVCPRVNCVGTTVCPSGRSDTPGLDTVKLYCPNCHDIYIPPSSRFQGVDGAFFGTTFAHLFFQSYRELAPAPFCKPLPANPVNSPSVRSPHSSSSSTSRGAAPFVNPNPHGGQKRAAGAIYLPRIYGFKVSERAKSGPRMQWLRLRPESPSQLEMVDWRGRWIDEDNPDYDSDNDNRSENEDRQMEDFDPDAGEDVLDEESESEPEEDNAPPPSTSAPSSGRRRVLNLAEKDTASSPPESASMAGKRREITPPILTKSDIMRSDIMRSDMQSQALLTIAQTILHKSPSAPVGRVQVVRQSKTTTLPTQISV